MAPTTYGGCTGPGVNSTQNLFVLEVPRHFVVPEHTAVEPDPAAGIRQELGAGSWLRGNARDPSARNPRCDPVGGCAQAIRSLSRTPAATATPSRTNTFANAIARTPTPGLNGYSGYQIFANDAYSIYHALQSNGVAAVGTEITSRRRTPSRRTLTQHRRETRRSTRPTTIRATSTHRAAFRISTGRTAFR